MRGRNDRDDGKKQEKLSYGIRQQKTFGMKAVDADGKSEDGAGIQVEIAPNFLKKNYSLKPDTTKQKNLSWDGF